MKVAPRAVKNNAAFNHKFTLKESKDNLAALRTKLASQLGIDVEGKLISPERNGEINHTLGGSKDLHARRLETLNSLRNYKPLTQMLQALMSYINHHKMSYENGWNRETEEMAHFIMGKIPPAKLSEEISGYFARFGISAGDLQAHYGTHIVQARLVGELLQTENCDYGLFGMKEPQAKSFAKAEALFIALYTKNEESSVSNQQSKSTNSKSLNHASFLPEATFSQPSGPMSEKTEKSEKSTIDVNTEEQSVAEKTFKDTDSTNSTPLNLDEIPNNERPTTIPQPQLMNQSMPLSSTNHTAKKNTSASFQSTKPESSDETAPYAASSNNESLSKSTPIPKTGKTATSGNLTKIDKGVLLERLKQQQANKIIELEQFINELTSKLNAKKLPLTGADFLSLKTEYNKRVSAFGKLPIDMKNKEELKKLSKKQIEIEKLISSKFQQSLDAIDLPLDIKTAFFPTEQRESYNPITLKIDADEFNKIRKYYILTIAAADSKYPEQQAKYIDYLERLVTLDNLSGTVTINPAYSKDTRKVGFAMSGDTSLTFVTDDVTTGFIFDAPSSLGDVDSEIIDTIGHDDTNMDAKLALHANISAILNIGAGNSKLDNNSEDMDLETQLMNMQSLTTSCPHVFVVDRKNEDSYEIHLSGDCNVMVKCGDGEQQKFFGLGAGVIIDNFGKKDWSQINKFNTTLFGATSGSTPSESSLVAYIDSEDKINELANNWDGYQNCEKDLSSPFGSDGTATIKIAKKIAGKPISLIAVSDGATDNDELLKGLAKQESNSYVEDQMRFTAGYMEKLTSSESSANTQNGKFKPDDFATPIFIGGQARLSNRSVSNF